MLISLNRTTTTKKHSIDVYKQLDKKNEKNNKLTDNN